MPLTTNRKTAKSEIQNPEAITRHNVRRWRELGQDEAFIRGQVPVSMWAELGLGSPRIVEDAAGKYPGIKPITVARIESALDVIAEAKEQRRYMSYAEISRAIGVYGPWLGNYLIAAREGKRRAQWAIEVCALADELCPFGDISQYKGAQRPANLASYYESQQHSRREESIMITWIYTLPGGATGSIRAASDDDAWNAVLAQIGQCPEVLIMAADEVAE